jgi:cytochrome d ubiquinol oxidase subunit I
VEFDPVLIARWQFGITTVYHFWMVPLTLGLGLLVAVLQTMWHRTGNEVWLRATKFWGKLYLINFIMGVATGLVQEFQFGMAWSEYSRFVGDVFGAPLAMEALLAFFLESTFIGLWIFGWGRLSRRVHLTVLWCAVIGSWISAYFIIVANSWMQHPVGVEMIDGRPVMTDVWAVLTNNTALAATSHTIAGAVSVGAAFLLGIAWHHLWRRRKDGIDTVDESGRVVVGEAQDVPGRDRTDYLVWWKSLRVGAWVAVFAFAAVALTGDIQAKLMYEQQPMKMASAEAACHDGTQFSVLTVGNLDSNDCDDVTPVIEIPGVLSFLANGDFTTDVPGVQPLIPEYQEAYGTYMPDDPMYGKYAGQEIDYQPSMFVTYWGFRIMIGFGALAAAAAVEVPLAPGPVGDRCALHRELRGLDLHGDGPAAVRRGAQPGPVRHRRGVPLHRGGRLAHGDPGDAAHVPGRVRPAVRRAHGVRAQAHHPVRTRRRRLRDAGAGARSIRQHPRDRHRRRGRRPVVRLLTHGFGDSRRRHG